jgi:hypothetical protein
VIRVPDTNTRRNNGKKIGHALKNVFAQKPPRNTKQPHKRKNENEHEHEHEHENET